MKLSPTTYFTKCRLKFVDFYGYSESTFNGVERPITIRCPNHGLFELKRAATHLYYSGGRCPDCRNEEKQQNFIETCSVIHGHKYNYSNSVFKTQHDSFSYVCPEHGEFTQSRAQSHLLGRGCGWCGGTKRLSTEEFITRATVIHNGFYSYDKSDYKTAKKPVTVTCPKHGDFGQEAYVHLAGSGCSKCVFKVRDTKTFIEQAKLIHGKRYDYSTVLYSTAHTKVQINCVKHGPFFKSPSKHIHADEGCPDCTKEEAHTKRMSEECAKFLTTAKEQFDARFDYSLIEYRGNKQDVAIICPLHGVFFQAPITHINSVEACMSCAANKRGKAKAEIAAGTFKIRAQLVHGKYYDYSKVRYKRSNQKVIIVCPEHGDFPQTPANHLSGNGCTTCATYGFDATKPAILYYLKISSSVDQFYKIGITNRTIGERFRGADLEKINVLNIWKFDEGINARLKEKEILQEFAKFRIADKEILDRGGNTELFTIDVLQLDGKH